MRLDTTTLLARVTSWGSRQASSGSVSRRSSATTCWAVLRPLRPLALAILAAVLVAPGALSAASTQEEPTQEFGEMIEVSEVLLDVLVTDRSDQVVVGLGPEDFIIEEDGKTLEPTGASFYSNRFAVRQGETGIQHPATGEEISDRYFILFFHDPRHVGGGALHGTLLRKHLDATRRAREWVEKERQPGDWVAVVSYDVKLKVQQDFTQDLQALETALDGAASGRDLGNQWESRRPEEVGDQPSLLANLPVGKKLRDATTRPYTALQVLAEATRSIVGRKNLMLFTLGWGDVRGFAGPISEPDRRFYPDMIHALNDNNVAVYPINLLPEATENIQGHFLNLLAADTGGTYYENFVNFITPMRQIADEASGYYLLSYQSEHPAGETGYRKVKVRTRNPEFKVKTRQGYSY